MASAGGGRDMTAERIEALRVELLILMGQRHTWQAQEAIHQELAKEFGARHGWKLSRKPFGLATLARRGVSDGRYDNPFLSSRFDHPYWYRRGGMPLRSSATTTPWTNSAVRN
jgi:hypothetical protein